MTLLKRLHIGYGIIVFSLLFIILFPFFLLPIAYPRWHRMVGILNRVWARGFFTLCFLPFEVECRSRLKASGQYIFCPNHFSYLDIPTMGLNPVNSVFVGKNEMENIPLFGFMYRRLHITVDRSKLGSRVNTFRRSIEALAEGKSLVIYPEGGIVSTNPPQLAPFKDGAFRAAIEKQIPIVPVTIPYNWIILPDGPLLLHARQTIKVVFHEPISTAGYTLDTVGELRKKVKEIIDRELQIHAAHHEYRQEDIAQDRSPVSAGDQA
jgi:1-acyl-sn-glycerol-3-phosphate acyltransferase